MTGSARLILIFGGTFDPPHRAHVLLPKLAARELGCDEVVYVPAAISPLKEAGPSASADDRVAMLRLALAETPRARISTIELERAGPSYMIDTLKSLLQSGASKATPQASFFLLIGADQALDFHRWKAWAEILELARPAVMLREPWTPESFRDALRERYGERETAQWVQWTLRTLPKLDISATEIRRRLRAGADVDDLLHPSVADYIRRNRLYDARPKG